MELRNRVYPRGVVGKGRFGVADPPVASENGFKAVSSAAGQSLRFPKRLCSRAPHTDFPVCVTLLSPPTFLTPPGSFFEEASRALGHRRWGLTPMLAPWPISSWPHDRNALREIPACKTSKVALGPRAKRKVVGKGRLSLADFFFRGSENNFKAGLFPEGQSLSSRFFQRRS